MQQTASKHVRELRADQRGAAKFIIFNTKFIVFNTKLLVLNTKIIIISLICNKDSSFEYKIHHFCFSRVPVGILQALDHGDVRYQSKTDAVQHHNRGGFAHRAVDAARRDKVPVGELACLRVYEAHFPED